MWRMAHRQGIVRRVAYEVAPLCSVVVHAHGDAPVALIDGDATAVIESTTCGIPSHVLKRGVEVVGLIAQLIFCRAYRRGPQRVTVG